MLEPFGNLATQSPQKKDTSPAALAWECPTSLQRPLRLLSAGALHHVWHPPRLIIKDLGSPRSLYILSRCHLSSTDRQLHKLPHVRRVSNHWQLYLQVAAGSIVLCTQFCKTVPTRRREKGGRFGPPASTTRCDPTQEHSSRTRRCPQNLLSASLSRVRHRLLGQLGATVNCVLDGASMVPDRCSSAKSRIIAAER